MSLFEKVFLVQSVCSLAISYAYRTVFDGVLRAWIGPEPERVKEELLLFFPQKAIVTCLK